MTMHLAKLNGEEVVLVRWRSNRPQAGDHMNVMGGEEGKPHRPIVRRLILLEQLYSRPYEPDDSMTEEFWSFKEMTDSEFHRMRHAVSKLETFASTHESLF